MKTFLIEAYVGRVELAAFERRVARMGDAAGTARGALVLRTILLPQDETCLCLIEAREAVVAHSIAGIAHLQPQRVIEVIDLSPSSLETRS